MRVVFAVFFFSVTKIEPQKTCFVCKMSRKHVFFLRGTIPTGLDRHYFIEMTGKETEIQGFKEKMSAKIYNSIQQHSSCH